MRLTLQKQITTALVLFGLVPASIVAAFGLYSNEEFKASKDTIIGQTSQAISTELLRQFDDHFRKTAAKAGEPGSKAGEPSETRWPSDADRDKIQQIIRSAANNAHLDDSAKITLISPDDKILIRKKGMTFEQNITGSRLPDLEDPYLKVTQDRLTPHTEEVTGSFSPTDKKATEVVGYAPILFSGVAKGSSSGHGYAILTAVPKIDAYWSVYSNQAWTIGILIAALGLTLFMGISFGRWFVHPLLQIIDVTQRLQQGQLYNRTNVRRGDELGELATQLNLVVDKWAELISQIRTMTSSVSTASNELNSSAHQLAQGSSRASRDATRNSRNPPGG